MDFFELKGWILNLIGLKCVQVCMNYYQVHVSLALYLIRKFKLHVGAPMTISRAADFIICGNYYKIMKSHVRLTWIIDILIMNEIIHLYQLV